MRELSYESLIEDYILALIKAKTPEFKTFLRFLLNSHYISKDDCENFLAETTNWWYNGIEIVDHKTGEVIFNNDEYANLKGKINRPKKSLKSIIHNM